MTPADIRAARKAAQLTQTEASAIAFVALRTWQSWEAGEAAMPTSAWLVFMHRTGQLHLAVDSAYHQSRDVEQPVSSPGS